MQMAYGYEYSRTGLYRSRSGLLFGVCKGIADYFDLSVFWTRMIVFLTFVFTGFCPVGIAYILAALLMKSEPRWYRYPA
jgi:phage shock protein C